MRVVVSTVIAGVVLVSGGAAMAQVPGQPVVARASYTVEPFTPMNQITIQGSGVRLRAEPFATAQTQVLSSGSTGLPLNVVGIARMGDWNWYQVVLKSGQKAFIRSDLTSHPSQGSTRGEAPSMPAAPVIAYNPTPAAPPPAYVPTPPPTPPAYTPPSYSAPIPIDPQPVQISPPASTGGSLNLDLPKPTDPPGLQSH